MTEIKRAPFRFVRKDEPLEIKSLVIVIFGLPGMGKTSLSFTADNPILEDFDDGVKRCVGRKDYLEIRSFDEVLAFHQSQEFREFAPKALIFDTGGKLLDDHLAQYVISQNVKNAKNGGGVSLQGYGAIKDNFRLVVNDIKSKGIDLVVVCHAEQYKDGEETRYRPKMTGGSYDILMGEADLVGFMESVNNKRTINFSPTDRHVGKNCAGFAPFVVPDATEPNYDTFLATIIQNTKDHMVKKSAAQEEAIKKIAAYKETIGEATLEQLNEVENEIATMSPSYRVQLDKLILDRNCQILEEQFVEAKTIEDFNRFYSIITSSPRLNACVPIKKRLLEFSAKQGLTIKKGSTTFEVMAGTNPPPALTPATNEPKAAETPTTEPPKEEKKATAGIGNKLFGEGEPNK